VVLDDNALPRLRKSVGLAASLEEAKAPLIGTVSPVGTPTDFTLLNKPEMKRKCVWHGPARRRTGVEFLGPRIIATSYRSDGHAPGSSGPDALRCGENLQELLMTTHTPDQAAAGAIDPKMLGILVCPLTKGPPHGSRQTGAARKWSYFSARGAVVCHGRQPAEGGLMIAAFRWGVVLSALSLLNCVPTQAARIVKAQGQAGSVVITVSGELVRGDENRFVQIAGTAESATVTFQGPGGNLFAGIEIGKVIRFKHFDTLVPNGSVCASACALAWLGGDSRLIGATGRIGFHAPYFRGPAGSIIAAPLGQAFVKQYLHELGLSEPATVYITETPPQKLKWLGFLEARMVGIDVQRAGRPP